VYCADALPQYGLVLPLCFVIACMFGGRAKWMYAGLSLLGFAAVYACFKWYEGYLAATLPVYAGYKYSGKIGDGPEMVKRLTYFFGLRHQYVLVQALAYAAPFALLFFNSLAKELRPAPSFLPCL